MKEENKTQSKISLNGSDFKEQSDLKPKSKSKSVKNPASSMKESSYSRDV